MNSEEMDSVKRISWSDSVVTIHGFTWTVKPSYNDDSSSYIIRRDQLFLSLLRENAWKRNIYFTHGFRDTERLTLDPHIAVMATVQKLDIANEVEIDPVIYEKQIKELLVLGKKMNTLSLDERRFFDGTRVYLLMRMHSYLKNDKLPDAIRLLELIDKYADPQKFPYANDQIGDYLAWIRTQL